MKLSTPLKMLATAVVFAGSFNLAPAEEVQGGGTTMSQPMSPKLGMVTQNRLNKAHNDRNNWLHVNGGYQQTRYYPATPIDTGTASKLRPALAFQPPPIETHR